MKNIHVLPKKEKLNLNKTKFHNEKYEPMHFYITSNEEIKEEDWVLCGEITLLKVKKEIYYNSIKLANNDFETKKIILTTDQDLIKDGVQAIDDEFIEWFVKNPSCEFVLEKTNTKSN
jgi:hypothetical protein